MRAFMVPGEELGVAARQRFLTRARPSRLKDLNAKSASSTSSRVRCLTADELRRFEQLEIVSATRRAGDRVWICPRGGCGVPVSADGGARGIGVPYRCSSCLHQLCGSCGAAWEPEHSQRCGEGLRARP